MHFFKKCNFPLVLFLFPLLSLSCPPLVPLVTGPFCKRALHLARINPNPESANYSKDGVQLARMKDKAGAHLWYRCTSNACNVH